MNNYCSIIQAHVETNQCMYCDVIYSPLHHAHTYSVADLCSYYSYDACVHAGIKIFLLHSYITNEAQHACSNHDDQ